VLALLSRSRGSEGRVSRFSELLGRSKMMFLGEAFRSPKSVVTWGSSSPYLNPIPGKVPDF